MPAADIKHPWSNLWAIDEGIDRENYWDKTESHQRYGYAKPLLTSCVGVLCAPDHSDGILAYICDLNSNKVDILRFWVRKELREDCPHPARVDLTGK